MEPRRPRTPAGASPFARSLALSLGLHGLAVAAGALVVLEALPDDEPGALSALVMLAPSEPSTESAFEATTEAPRREVEPPALSEAELVPVEVSDDAPYEPLTAEQPLLAAALVDWSTTRVDTRPLRRAERPAALAEPAPDPAAEPPAEPAPRGESRAPRLIDGPPPSYPRVALRLQQQGSVLLEIEVDAAGRVAAVSVLESSGFARLDQAAREGVLAWRFEPALRDGAPVAERFRHRVEFVIES